MGRNIEGKDGREGKGKVQLERGRKIVKEGKKRRKKKGGKEEYRDSKC